MGRSHLSTIFLTFIFSVLVCITNAWENGRISAQKPRLQSTKLRLSPDPDLKSEAATSEIEKAEHNDDFSSSSTYFSLQNKNRKNRGADENDRMTIDEMLDKPFFDPDSVPDDTSIFSWFANLIKQDYVTAEALYVSTFFALMVVVGQELLRMYVHGEKYIPFHRVVDHSGGLW